MLLGQLTFAYGQTISKKKVLQRMMMQNIQNVKLRLTTQFEVETQLAGTQAVMSLTRTHETAQGLARMEKLLLF